MSLPKIDLPIFELTLPSSGEKIKYRPFTVKEEKILLVAQESDDDSQEILATKQIVNNCLIDKDVSTLPMFDLEYILLALRARSVNNTISFSITDPDTEEQIEVDFDIDNITVARHEDHTNKIKINDEWTLFLKYPTIDEFIRLATGIGADPLSNYLLMTSCLDKVASEDEVYDFKEYDAKQIDEFMDNMGQDVVKGIQKFFETIPRLRQEIKYKNKNGDDKTFVIEGMKTFFI
jgi:hypothetical protein